ncbi:MAG: hypothetical protein FJW38_07565 [Acidobacteria bacterium]|nr:hypothetical protein [Acidobacteriota bacterium]
MAKAIDRRIIPLLLLASCSVERPVFQPTYDRLAGLKYFAPPAMPDLASEDTDDEAEIQFRAAFVFYDTLAGPTPPPPSKKHSTMTKTATTFASSSRRRCCLPTATSKPPCNAKSYSTRPTK